MSFPFSPTSRAGRQYDELPEETALAEEEGQLTADQLKPLNDIGRDPFEFVRLQDGGSIKGSSVAASEDLPDLVPVHNRDHSVISVASTAGDLRSAFGSAGSGSSLWSSGSLAKDVAPAAASDDAGSVNSTDPDFGSRMAKYNQRRNERLSKKKSRQTNTYGDFLGKSANSKHSEDALSMSLGLRGMKIDLSAVHGSLIETDIPCKVYILHINEKLPPAERFVIQDLDETHLLVQPHRLEYVKAEVKAWQQKNQYTPPADLKQ